MSGGPLSKRHGAKGAKAVSTESFSSDGGSSSASSDAPTSPKARPPTVAVDLDEEPQEPAPLSPVAGGGITAALGSRPEARPAPENPFVYHGPSVGVYEFIKLAFMTVTFFPVKLILTILTLSLIGFFSWLAVVGLSAEALRTQPLSGCRRFWLYPAQYLCRLQLFICGYVWIRRRGKLDPRASVVAVAPHTNFIDPLLFYWEMWPSGVSAAENARVCFVGAIIRASQAILVARDDPNSRHGAVDAIKFRATSPLPWRPTLLFPEGTCTNRRVLITFKSGAFRPGVAVQPVAIRYPNRFFDHAWVPVGPSKLVLLWRMLCQFVNWVEIDYLPLYEPSAAEKADCNLFAANVRAEVARVLEVGVTQHTYEDCKLQHKAIKDKFPASEAVVEFGALQDLYGYSLDDVKALMDRFETADVDHDGRVNIDEFAQFLGLRVSEPVRHAFAMFDADDSGQIDLREFLVGMALLNGISDREEVFRFAFALFDPKSKGAVSKRRFVRFMRLVFAEMSDADAEALFDRIDTEHAGAISYEQFRSYGEGHPEYVQVFLEWQRDRNVDLDEWRARARVEDTTETSGS
eukprot:Amastigsp_a840988_16.p1 type:complete len:576 gc:universal Amastigsp_a840988_16:44-1771(+)